MEEIFTERDQFKKAIFRNIQGELDQFGLKIYNANVKELRDAPESSYFASLSRKAHEGAINQARIDVAEAQRKGNVGEAQRQGEQNREIAKVSEFYPCNSRFWKAWEETMRRSALRDAHKFCA